MIGFGWHYLAAGTFFPSGSVASSPLPLHLIL